MKFKIKIETKTPGVGEKPFSLIWDNLPITRIGVPSDLIQGDVIIVNNESYYVQEVIRKDPIYEEVYVTNLMDTWMPSKRLPAGEIYQKLAATTKLN